MADVLAFPRSPRTQGQKPDGRAQRAARRARQAAELNDIRALPEEEQAAALYDAWPGKLPKIVRRRLTGDMREAWRCIRADEVQAREAMFLKHVRETMGSPMDLEDFLRLLPAHRLEEARASAGEAADRLIPVLAAVRDPNKMTLTWMRQSFQVLSPRREDVLEDPVLRTYLCLMIFMGGNVVLREGTRLKAPVTGDDGQTTWVAQDRVYGVSCGQGGWVAQPADAMRRAYMTDAWTGEPLPPDPSTLMGDARELVKRAAAGFRAS